ncbi:retrovirus-related pol polyprotein from transposon TNT 1-94 [Tanacetum coccineum]
MENSQSQQASTNASVSTSHARKIYTNEDVVRIRPTTRKGDVWSNYDMCIMIDGVEKARCKKCMKFYNPGSNSTLRTHKSGCNAVSQNDTSQGTIGADGQVFIFDNDAVRLDFTKFVIQQALPFNHFDNVKLTEIIKRRLQPRYQHVSRTTLRSDAFKLWETAKKDIIDGFRDYKYGVSITTDTWTAPHGSESRPLMLEKPMYDSWKTWIILYIRGKDNGEMLKDSIDNGPFQLKPDIAVKDTDGVTDIRRPQKVKDLSVQEKLRYDNDIKAVNILLLRLPVDIYTLINHYHTAKEICDRVKELMEGRQSQGYVGNARKNQALGVRVINIVGDVGTNQPRADHVDAYHSDCDNEATTNAIFMENLSPVGSINGDIVEPRYDSNIISKVPHYDTYHESDVLNFNIQELGYIENIVFYNTSYDELTSNSNVISYGNYMVTIRNDEDNYVPPPVQKNDVILSIINEIKSQVERCNTVNQETQSVNESLTSKLERYKERVKILENFDKEAFLDRELRTVITKLISLTPFPKSQFIPKVVEKNDLKNTVTSHLNTNKIIENCTKVFAPGLLKIESEPINAYFNNNMHRDYLKVTKERVATLQDLLDEARALKSLDEHISHASKFAERIQELLVYVSASCPFTQSGNEKWAPATCYKKNDKPYVDASSSKQIVVNNTKKHTVKQNTQKTDNTMLPSIGKVSYIDASGSKPKSKTNNDRIPQPSSRRKKNKVDAHHRKFKSSANKNNHVSDCNANIKNAKYVNQKEKNQWKPTGRVFITVGLRWKPTRRMFNMEGKIIQPSPATIVPPGIRFNHIRIPVVAPNKETRTVEIVLWYLDFGCSEHMTEHRDKLINFVSKFIGTVRFGNNHFAAIMGYKDLQIRNILISRVYYVEGLGVDILSRSRGSNLYTISMADMMKSSPICLLFKASKTKSWLWHRHLSHLNFGTINQLAKQGLVKGLPKLNYTKDHLTKDEASEIIIKFLKQAQVSLKATVRYLRTDNGTEFINQTLQNYTKEAKAIAIAYYTQNRSACSFMLCDLDFEPLSLSLSSLPSCDLESLTNILILCLILKASNQSLRKNTLEPALNLTVHCCGREFRVLNGYDTVMIRSHLMKKEA